MKDLKTLNSTCICKFRLNAVNCEVIMIEPCEHLIHSDCLNNNICPYCDVKIKGFTKRDDYKKNKRLTQKCIDILSMSSVDDITKKNNFEILSNIPYCMFIMSQLYTVSSQSDAKKICKSIFSMAGLTLKIKGMNKIKNNDKKVFIANHVGYFDSIILYYILGCGFLASSGIKDDIFFKNAVDILPILLIQRGTQQDTVNRMKQFVKQHGSICLFPEGMFSYPGTISRFRSGAFKIGSPIYPIVLKYNKCVLDTNGTNFALKVGSGLNEVIEIIFLDPFYPPFNDDTPELIRENMASTGLQLSRVLGNDYNDN